MTTPQNRKSGWSDLADALGVARGTVWTWRRKAGAPTTQDELAWREWLDREGLGSKASKLSPERAELLRQKLRREIALLDVKVAQARRQVIDADEVEEVYKTIHAGLKAELTQWAKESPVPELPAGADISAIREAYQEVADDLLDRLAAGWKRWLAPGRQ